MGNAKQLLSNHRLVTKLDGEFGNLQPVAVESGSVRVALCKRMKSSRLSCQSFLEKALSDELADEEAARLIDDLQRLDLPWCPINVLFSEAFALAVNANDPVYKCLYLALSHLMRDELADIA